MSHARAGRLLRFVRWTRLLAHLWAALFILRFVFPRASRARRRVLHGWWSRKLVRVLGLDARIEGPLPAAGAIGAMVAANHVSWLDVVLVSCVLPTRFIGQSEGRDLALARWIVQRARK